MENVSSSDDHSSQVGTRSAPSVCTDVLRIVGCHSIPPDHLRYEVLHGEPYTSEVHPNQCNIREVHLNFKREIHPDQHLMCDAHHGEQSHKYEVDLNRQHYSCAVHHCEQQHNHKIHYDQCHMCEVHQYEQQHKREVHRSQQNQHLLTIFIIFTCILTLGFVYINVSYSPEELTNSSPSSFNIRHKRSYSRSTGSNSAVNYHKLSSLHYYKATSCHSDVSSCSIIASHPAFTGNGPCRCRHGYYVSGAYCKECSRLCPFGYYAVGTCTDRQDLKCQRCRICGFTQYEVAPCTSSHDRICLDISFPSRSSSMINKHSSDLYAQVSDRSSNVFIERLRAIKPFEEPLYLTSNQGKSMSVVWTRESGLEIRVTVNGENLMPTYEDEKHEGDNIFIRRSHRTTETELNGLEKATKYFCRNPHPDYYHLGLRILTKRTTALDRVHCDSTNISSPSCPPEYQDGDVYYRRHINEKCPLTQAEEPLTTYSNSFLCSESTPLLEDIFRLRMRPLVTHPYPSASCENAKNLCLHCLDNQNITCNRPVKQCCMGRCYGQPFCQVHHSSSCQMRPPLCATGDVFEYTLEPSSRSLSIKFQCPLKRLTPGYIYTITYSVLLPSMKGSVHTVTRFIPFSSSAFSEHAHHKMDFIHVSHNAGVSADEHVIVTGHFGKTNNVDVSIIPARINGGNADNDFNIVNPTEWSFTTSVQFDRPFRFSSSSWSTSRCTKNISWIYPAKTLGRKTGVNATAQIHKIGESFRYRMFPRHMIPFIRIKIPENESVLPWLTVNASRGYIEIGSLIGHLAKRRSNGRWIIEIEGQLAVCPAIVKITVHDQCSGHIIDQFDAFINCPSAFKFSFSIHSLKNNTFAFYALVLYDYKRTHILYISNFPPVHYLPVSYKPVVGHPRTSPWKTILTLLAAFTISLIVTFVFKLLTTINYTKRRTSHKQQNNQNDFTSTKVERVKLMKTTREKPISCNILCLFVVLYVIYALVFSFTAIFGSIYLLTRDGNNTSQDINDAKKKIKHSFLNEVLKMSTYIDDEIKRISNIAKERYSACNVHLLKDMFQFWNKSIYASNRNVNHGSVMYGGLRDAIVKKYERFQERFTLWSEHFHGDTLKHLSHLELGFKKYLKKIKATDWFEFSRMLYKTHKKLRHVNKVRNPDIGYFDWLGVNTGANVIDTLQKLSIKASVELPALEKKEFSEILRHNYAQQNIEPYSNSSEIIISFILVNGSNENWLDNQSAFKNMHSVNSHKHQIFNLTTFDDREEGNISSNDFIVNHRLWITCIAVFALLDVVLLMNRVGWLVFYVRSLRCGVHQHIPIDGITEKALRHHTTNCWSTDRYEMYDNTETISSKYDDVIRDGNIGSGHGVSSYIEYLISKENRQPHICKQTNSSSSLFLFSMFYKFKSLIASKETWKFVISVLLLCLLCLATEVIDVTVTTEFAYNNFGAHYCGHLRDHQIFVNNIINDYTSLVNRQLVVTSSDIQAEIEKITFAVETLLQQTNATANQCLGNNSTSDCDFEPLVLLPCNFVPIVSILYLPLYHVDKSFADSLMSELSPILTSIRYRMFLVIYIFIGLVCLWLLCHLVASTVTRSVLQHDLVPFSFVLQAAHPSQVRSNCIENSIDGSCPGINDNKLIQRESNL